MRVVFFGSSSISCAVLGHLLGSSHELVAVVTQPDTPSGRRMEYKPTPVCMDVTPLGIPVFKPEKLANNRELRSELAALEPDALLVVSYGKIIPKSLLKLTDWPINVHPSDLPRLRGASPVRTALLLGLESTAVCIMKMTPRLDDGDIMLREPYEISRDISYGKLELELGLIGGRLAVDALDSIAAGTVSLSPQDDDDATYCRTFDRRDTEIDWSTSAKKIESFVRAWDPDMGAYTLLDDNRRLKIWRVSIESPPEDILPQIPADAQPGQVLSFGRRVIWVMTGDGVVAIEELQPDNKKRMPTASWLAGNTIEPGQSFVPCSQGGRCFEE
ncbi:MAG: methionyl-tRNA formyltransferase [Planctomycetales bacterium]|nr:methionyl-tRNA formyltransferase [bacterium]UNM07987.1 MAG: methionyl-tRNA formyltransferase [Planctomycetales bacterium]